MFPFAAVGLGLNALGAVGGLLGANAAAKRAKEARDRALNDYEVNNDRRYRDLVSSDTRNLYGLKGKFGDLLLSDARTGGALDAAGLGGGLQRYNSTATIGDLLNRQSGYNSSLQGALVDANSREQQMLGDNQANALRMAYGTAGDDLNYARQQQAGTLAGFSNLLGQIPSLFPGGQPQSEEPVFGYGAQQAIDHPPVTPIPPLGALSGNNNYSMPTGPLNVGGITRSPSLQSGLQTATSQFSPAGNSYGPAYNGGFNMKLPSIGKAGQYMAPLKQPVFANGGY